jgi:hypothetical protein
MSETKVHQNRNNSSLEVDAVVQGLRRLVRVGRATPGAVLAVPELSRLPLHMGREEQEAEAAIRVAAAVMSAIEETSMPKAARALLGTDDDKVRPVAERRMLAAEQASVTPDSFRVRREPRLLDELARALLIELAATSADTPARSRSTGGAHLEIERGSVRTTIPIPAGRSPILIGRDPDCDVELRDDPLVSRHHAQLSLVNNAWILEDLGSLNGTETDSGAVTAPARVRDGDVITIGHTRLRFRLDQDDPAATMAR